MTAVYLFIMTSLHFYGCHDIQHDDIQHNDTQHNARHCYDEFQLCSVSFMLCVTVKKPFILSFAAPFHVHFKEAFAIKLLRN
jgi:hypothetical protein